MKKPTLPELLKTALYIGTIGYGGPAILALMKKVIANEKAWLSEEEFMNALSLTQILPGAMGVTLFGYIGHKLRPPWGGLLAPFAFVLPAVIAITGLAWAYFTYENLTFVNSIFMGLGAMVVALVINATLIMGKAVFYENERIFYRGLLIASLAFFGMAFLRLNIIYIILLAGVLGLLLNFSMESGQLTMPVKIQEKIATRKVHSWIMYLPFFVAVCLLGAVFFFIDGTWTIFATFFKIGSFAFGGGFAAIPLIQHVVVDGMHWINLTTFRDGIALGQITPGPVLITATFIGYKVAGITGALIATAGIFTPSLAAVILVSGAHAKIQNLKAVKAVIRGLLSGFIGLLLFITYQFGLQSLVDKKTWLVFIISLFYLVVWKKDVIWLILGTIGASLLLF
ncbi:MAG: chromate efflux transporter [Smithella sp.]